MAQNKYVRYLQAFRDDVFIFAPIEPNTGFWGKFVSMIKGDEEEYFYEDRELEETNEQDVLPISKTVKKVSSYFLSSFIV